MSIARAIEFGALVGGQLTALIEAEASAAEASSDYIEKVGFQKLEDGTLAPRMVNFEMERRGTDGKIRKHRLKIPVLTLVPIPLLTISEATIDFDLQIEDIKEREVEENSDEQSDTRSSISKFLRRKNNAKLITRVARTSREASTTRADLKMSVLIQQSGLPVGIEKLLLAAELSVDDQSDG